MQSLTARRSLILVALIGASALVPASASAAPVTLANWDAAQQRLVVRAGLMGQSGRSFQGAAPLTAAQANAAIAMIVRTTRLIATSTRA